VKKRCIALPLLATLVGMEGAQDCGGDDNENVAW